MPLQQVWWWVGGAILILVALMASFVVMVVIRDNRPIPEFPRLSSNPDSTLVGTVAYVDDNECIRIIALRGEPSKELYCIPKWDIADAAKLGKPTSPQLVWLNNGKLEATFFRMSIGPGFSLSKGWQVVIDVDTGAVSETSEDLVPSALNLTTRPTTNAAGDVLSFSSNGETGKVVVVLTSKSGVKRTLLDVRGPGSYGYGMKSVFWGPAGKTIFADDGRILVIVPTSEPLTRMLVGSRGGSAAGFADDESRGSDFAVTTMEYLQPSES